MGTLTIYYELVDGVSVTGHKGVVDLVDRDSVMRAITDYEDKHDVQIYKFEWKAY